ncbi:MAG: membrane dipeptidase [Chloroflexi bacterium]|nr:membrane dipeptidase [Chloroflexota bacterium]
MNVEDMLHASVVIDLHNDTIVAHMRQRNASIARTGFFHGPERNGIVTGPYGSMQPPDAALQLDLAGMRSAGLDAGFFAVDVTLAHNSHLAYGLDGLGYLLYDMEEAATEATHVRTLQDLERIGPSGSPALVLHIEHADVTEKSLNVLYALFALGVRSIGLTHNVGSCAADGCWDAREGVGLTVFGERLVREMNRLGMVVDLAHASPGAFYRALEVSTRPVLFSHGNSRALCDTPRNLTDHQLRALSEQGGVIGVSFVPAFVDSEAPDLEKLLAHFDHIVEVAGIEHVGLGSDFDGGGTLLPDVAALEDLVAGLWDRGYSGTDLRRILGENALRILRDNLPAGRASAP